MSELLFWLYLTNSVLLIVHEMDSVYWKEWDLFGLGGGVSGFLVLHFPLLFLVLLRDFILLRDFKVIHS